MTTLLTVGHGTLTAEALAELLRGAGVELLVDVRRYPWVLDDARDADATRTPTAVMCSESFWWRCHRRLVADVVALTSDVAVQHLAHDGRRTPHPVAEGARRRADGRVTW